MSPASASRHGAGARPGPVENPDRYRGRYELRNQTAEVTVDESGGSGSPRWSATRPSRWRTWPASPGTPRPRASASRRRDVRVRGRERHGAAEPWSSSRRTRGAAPATCTTVELHHGSPDSVSEVVGGRVGSRASVEGVLAGGEPGHVVALVVGSGVVAGADHDAVAVGFAAVGPAFGVVQVGHAGWGVAAFDLAAAVASMVLTIRWASLSKPFAAAEVEDLGLAAEDGGDDPGFAGQAAGGAGGDRSRRCRGGRPSVRRSGCRGASGRRRWR